MVAAGSRLPMFLLCLAAVSSAADPPAASLQKAEAAPELRGVVAPSAKPPTEAVAESGSKASKAQTRAVPFLARQGTSQQQPPPRNSSAALTPVQLGVRARCAAKWETCTVSRDCCSGSCVPYHDPEYLVCLDAPCAQKWTPCTADAQCCNGVCAPYHDPEYLVCLDAPCAQKWAPCTADAQCCNGVCGPYHDPENVVCLA